MLWILCDEWDYRLTFVDPDPTLQLPEISRLRGEVLFADHAMPPGPETPVSIPGYFTGKFVRLQFELEAAATNVEMMVAPKLMEEHTVKLEAKRRTGSPVEPGLSK